MTYQERARRIAICRTIEKMATDNQDGMVLYAARRCIQAYGWMKRPDRRDWGLVREFADGVSDIEDIPQRH